MIVILGARGQLGTAFAKVLPDAAALTRDDADLSVPGAVSSVIGSLDPSLVINCAAYTAVDRAEAEEDLATRINGAAVGELAESCARSGARLVTFSTDYVFDGSSNRPYVESDPTDPVNAYGRSKRVGEDLALGSDADVLVIRTAWVMAGTHRNFASVMIDLISQGDVRVVNDQRGCPTLVDDLVTATMRSVQVGASGLLHLTNAGSTTWYLLAREIARYAGLDPDRVHPCTTEEYPTPARRPANSMLDSERLADFGIENLPPYGPSLERAVGEMCGL